MIVLIAAMNKHRTIGLGGAMPWHNPEDLAHFRNVTYGQKLLMGRKTFEGLPRKLDNRTIFTASRDANCENGVSDITSFLHEFKNSEEVLFIAGGGEIYKYCLPYADKILLSIIDNEIVGDIFFPVIPKNEFEITEETEYETFKIVTYERIQ